MFEFEKYLTFSQALFVSFVSILVVFSILLLIALIVSGLGKILKDEKPVAAAPKAVSKPVAPTTAPVVNKAVNLGEVMSDEHKKIAALVATIAANESNKDAKYRVVSIKEI